MAVIKGGFEIVKRAMLKELMKRGDDGIMLTLPKNEIVDLNARITMDRLIKAGIDPDSLTSPDQVLNILENINNQMMKNTRVLSNDEAAKFLNKAFPKKGEVFDLQGNKLNPNKPIMGGTQGIETLLKKGDVTKGTVSKKSDKVVEREMFEEANKKFNQTDIVADSVARITSMEPVAAMKEANKIIKREGIYKNLNKNQSQKILKDTDDWINQRDPADKYDYKNNRPFRDDPNFDPDDPDFDPEQGFYTGGRAGFDNGGISGLRSDPEVAKKINKILEDKLIKQQPEGVLMDPPPRPNYELIEEMLNPKDKGLLPNNTIEFDDGTIFFKDSGEYYKQDGTEVEGPSKGAKVKPITMEAATGGRAGYYTGGMVDVEPNLSDIGHGSDALMARTRLVAPNSQATTSTGLNYLLAEDNDNIRVPFGNGKSVYDRTSFEHKINELKAAFKHYKRGSATGGRQGVMTFEQFAPLYAKENFAEGGRTGFSSGGMGRRAFLKLLATLGGTTAAFKTGILGLGEGAGKKAVTETIKKSAGSGQPPPYFFELMETISKNGKEIKSYGERVKQTVAPSKDGKSELLMTEDLNTGSVQIKKIHKEGDDMVTKSEEMTYTKNMGDESTQGKPADDYEEVTEFNSRIYKDEFNEPDFVDGIDVESIIKEVDVNPQDVGKIKYKPRADGGRIGFSAGKLAQLGITGSSRRFLEKVFGKGSLDEMIKRDPELHRGLLEVVEMFRNRDKEGLKMYMQKFLPHMDDETVEAFIKGDAVDAAGQGKYGLDNMQGQLIRLGSGRDYQGKLEAMKRLENAQKLDTLDVTEEMIRKPNASGGIQTMLGE